MMKPLAALVLCGSFVPVPAPAAPADLPPETELAHEGWYAELPPALAEARRTGKDVLIDFGGSDWCLPCKLLKDNILVKPEFIERASRSLVLVDIDDRVRGLSPERKARYRKLQEQYKVGTFPSVFLATPEGLPYAWTTYIPPKGLAIQELFKGTGTFDTPERFWAQLEPFLARGKAFREGLARAETLSGHARANAMVDALSQVRADFLDMHYADRIAELTALDPADTRGFLAYLAGQKAVEALEMKAPASSGYGLNPEVKAADVDALIAAYHLKGETLQRALVIKAVALIIDGRPREALAAIDAFVAAENTRSAFDRGDFMEVTPAEIAALRQRLAEGTARPGDTAAQYLALHHLFEDQAIPNRYRISCRGAGFKTFVPMAAVRKPISDGYGEALLASTAALTGEARAQALIEGLKGTLLGDDGPLGTILYETLPALIGMQGAISSLPEPYSLWVRNRQARQN